MHYFITFTCYGARLHGDESGSVDRSHNQFGTPSLKPDPRRTLAQRRAMPQPPYHLDRDSRTVVLQSLKEVSRHRGWNLLAAHVRSNHVHVIVEADAKPEKVMSDFKAYSSRRLNQSGHEEPGHRRWARHGSTRRLWKDQQIRDAIRYVILTFPKVCAIAPR